MIGIFDSGIGGLSVFVEIRKLLPDESYIYFADNANCPYGGKSREFIIGRAREISEALIRSGSDIVVVACNTATAAAITALRSEFSDPTNPLTRERVLSLSGGRRDHIRFIGMEPAIKPAVSLTKSGVIGVLATEGTLKAEKYRHTRDLTHGNVTVAEHVGEGFVELVESGELSGPHAEKVVGERWKKTAARGSTCCRTSSKQNWTLRSRISGSPEYRAGSFITFSFTARGDRFFRGILKARLA